MDVISEEFRALVISQLGRSVQVNGEVILSAFFHQPDKDGGDGFMTVIRLERDGYRFYCSRCNLRPDGGQSLISGETYIYADECEVFYNNCFLACQDAFGQAYASHRDNALYDEVLTGVKFGWPTDESGGWLD